ncbi:MAG TPA: (2Fe-2S)-binding protein [Actinomycetes bacterium]|nr:(2Fe-2S)-binding protein [Actinomycetes bacterium]
MYACICLAVTETEVSDAIEAGASSEDEVGEACGAGTGCGSCLDRICDMIGARYPLHGRAPLRAAG